VNLEEKTIITRNSTESILGYPVVKENIVWCVDSIMDWVRHGDHCRYLACINPHSYVVSKKHVMFARALQNATWLIPDGSGIVLASRYLNGSIKHRITGSDVFYHINRQLNLCAGSVFFLGSTVGTLAMMQHNISRDFPYIRIAGTYAPPFKPVFTDEDNERMIAEINAAEADVLWVGMTSPKQDLWLYQHQDRLQVKFAAGIGAVFDFYSGRIKRSHPVFLRLGLEWLPRLMQEPRRLWRRTCISAPVFLWDVIQSVRH